ncbi:MAG: hypothetical protein ACI9YH_000395 [Colwellia sp.]|jgi:hypothetical protein
MKSIEVKKLSLTQVEAMEEKWNKCLHESGGNPLFLDWYWQLTWWETWNQRLKLSLLVIGIFENNELIGIAPMYSYSYKKLRFFNIKACEFIGDHSRNNDSIRSEYLNFILPKNRYTEILPYLFEFLKHEGIDEVCLKDVPESSDTVEFISAKFSDIQKRTDIGIKLSVNGNFSEYKKLLGKNTRLKLFNRRKLLSLPEVEHCKNEKDLIDFFHYLNTFHVSRWGRDCYSIHSLDFHKKIANYYLRKNELNATLLKVNSKVVAVSYDICREEVRYNIQLGFEEFINNKISFGTLMLGYSVEEAFNNLQISQYDFLAGGGKHTFYKERFKGNKIYFSTVNIPLTMKVKLLLKLITGLKKSKRFIFK